MVSDELSSNFTFGQPLTGALLRMPWESIQRHMLERAHERGFGDVDAAHLNVFQYPGPQGTRPRDLAERLRMSKQALNYLLGELERLGYLERRADPDDQRSKRIALTRRGISLGQAMREAVEELERAWSRQLGAKRFEQLRALLVDLNEVAAKPS